MDTQKIHEHVHEHDREFRDRLVKEYCSSELKAFGEAIKTLQGAGFPVKDTSYSRISRSEDLEVHVLVVSFCLACSAPDNEKGHGSVYFVTRKQLSPVQREESLRYEAEKFEMWDVYDAEVKRKEEEELRIAREKERHTKPLTFEQLVAFVSDKDKIDECERFYRDHGPDKHEQEEHYETGVSMVWMNVGLMKEWLEEHLAAKLGFGMITNSSLVRQVWEASHFHYGISGYSQEDVGLYFSPMDSSPLE